MTLACLYLYITVIFPPVGKLPPPPREHYTVIECRRDSNMSMNEYGSSGVSECEIGARQLVRVLQHGGVLPGAGENIYVSFECNNET